MSVTYENVQISSVGVICERSPENKGRMRDDEL